MEIAIYFSRKLESFLPHMKDIKGEPINIVGIYPLQAEFQGKKTEKKNHLAKGITVMSKL